MNLKAKITDTTTRVDDNAPDNVTAKASVGERDKCDNRAPIGERGSRALIDTSEEKFQTSPDLKRWAE